MWFGPSHYTRRIIMTSNDIAKSFLNTHLIKLAFLSYVFYNTSDAVFPIGIRSESSCAILFTWKRKNKSYITMNFEINIYKQWTFKFSNLPSYLNPLMNLNLLKITSMNMTTHLHLLLMLRLHGNLSPLPHIFLWQWLSTWKTFHLAFPLLALLQTILIKHKQSQSVVT